MDKQHPASKNPSWPSTPSRVISPEKVARRADYLSKAPEIRLLEDAEIANRLIRERIAKKRIS